jgi:hypothetical protein
VTKSIQPENLSIAARADLITQLQIGCTSHAEELEIQDIFLATHERDLTELKNLIDGGDDFHDLLQLIEHDIDDPQIRKTICDHIAREGALVRAGAGYVPALKVLSDIDDTVVSKFYDRKLRHNRVYPGVVAFDSALDAVDGTLPGSQGDKAFLSARPSDPLGLIETASHKALQSYGFAHKQILTGTLWSIRSKHAMGAQKVVTYGEYQSLFPEYNFVFTGDSGQGDAFCAETISTQDPAHVKATFIHDVWSKAGPKTSPEERARLASKGVHVFDTYIGAITAALQAGLVSSYAAAAVARAAWADFDRFSDEDFHSAPNRATYALLLRADTTKLNAILPLAEQIIPSA